MCFDVSFGKVYILENTLFGKFGKCTGNVHFIFWLLEGWTLEVRSKSVSGGSTLVGLVDERKSNRLSERPLEQIIMFRFHQYKEHRDVCTLSNAITIQIHSCAHMISLWAGEVGWAVDTHCAAINSFSVSPSKFWNFPDKTPVSSSHISA